MWQAVPHAKLLAAIALVLVVYYVVRLITHRDRSDSSQFYLDDLLIDPITRKASPSRAVLLGSFGLASWVVVYHTLTNKLTENELGLFLLTFAAPAVTNIVGDKFGNKPAAQASNDQAKS